MHQKVNKKQNHSSKVLYTKITQVLSAQKNNVKLRGSVNIKSRAKSYLGNSKQRSMSHSLNLNNAILQNTVDGFSFNNVLDLNKSNIQLSKAMTPYQLKKNQSKIQKQDLKPKTQQKSPSRYYYYEIKQQKSPKNLKLNQLKRKRAFNFFKNFKQKNHTEPAQNDQNLTYSLILKDIKSKNDQSKNPTQENYKADQYDDFQQKICEHCEQRLNISPSFFKNQQIKKNIQLIQQLKKSLSSDEKVAYKHFPQVQILNQTYFNESKKKLINHLNSKDTMKNLTKMQFFLSQKKSYQKKCKKCISIDRKFQKQKQKLVTQPSNFQYFFYEYKTTGQSTPKMSLSSKSQSKMYIKRNKSKAQRQAKGMNINKLSNHQNKSGQCISINTVLQDFIKHQKITVPERPHTAVVNSSQVIYHRTPMTCKNVYTRKVLCQENFVKPWENNSAQVDQEF